jgi:hypothetical protein
MAIESRTDPHPVGYVKVTTYRPYSCPWDYYIAEESRVWKRIMERAGIKHTICVTRETNTTPHGSGSGGQVRFGDSMLPGYVDLWVAPGSYGRARDALAGHAADINAWLHNGADMPEILRR